MTLRHSYYDNLWVEISDTLEADRKELEACIDAGYKKFAEYLNKEGFEDKEHQEQLVKEFVNLPTTITMGRFALLEERRKREYLSQETRIRLARRLELRRMYAVHVFMEHMMHIMKMSFDVFLDAFTQGFHRDAIEAGYDDLAARESAVVQTTFHFCMGLYSRNGRPTFVPSPGLTDALTHTEFRDVPNDLLKLPHPAIFIEAPSGSGLSIPNIESGLHELAGAFVIERSIENNYRRFHVLLIGKSKETKNGEVFDRAVFNDALAHFDLPLKIGGTLGESLNEVTSNKDWNNVLSRDGSFDDWKNDGVAGCARFVLNTLLYITLPDAEIKTAFAESDVPHLLAKLERTPKGSPKREKLNSQLKKLSQNKLTFLGSSIKIDRPNDSSDGHSHSGTDRKVNVAFIRRGHWRNQPYGPGRQQTKLLWIRPTMINPGGPVKVTTYNLE